METYFVNSQARIHAIKKHLILKRALQIDARSKIKPTLSNPSLMDMSNIRRGGSDDPRQPPSSMTHTQFVNYLLEKYGKQYNKNLPIDKLKNILSNLKAEINSHKKSYDINATNMMSAIHNKVLRDLIHKFTQKIASLESEDPKLHYDSNNEDEPQRLKQ